MSKDRAVPHEFEGESLESVFVGRRDGQGRPTVILIPTVMGVTDLEIGFGRQLVELGYNAFVADLFGKQFHGAPRDTMFGEMTRLRGDRTALRRRLQHVLEIARGLDEVPNDDVVVAGSRFARSSATGCPVWIERPRLPRTRSRRYRAYWTGSGRSRPRSCRIARI